MALLDAIYAGVREAAVWTDGSGAPNNAVGDNGDYYLRTDTGQVYRKSAGTYSLAYTPSAGGSALLAYTTGNVMGAIADGENVFPSDRDTFSVDSGAWYDCYFWCVLQRTAGSSSYQPTWSLNGTDVRLGARLHGAPTAPDLSFNNNLSSNVNVPGYGSNALRGSTATTASLVLTFQGVVRASASSVTVTVGPATTNEYTAHALLYLRKIGDGDVIGSVS